MAVNWSQNRGASPTAPDRWIEEVQTDPEHQHRWQALIGPHRPEVQDVLNQGMQHGASSATMARAGAWALDLATQSGWEAVEVLEHGWFLVRHSTEEQVALAPLVCRLTAGAWGDRALLARVVDHLENVFAGRRFVLHLRRPLVAGNPAVIANAVQLWMRDMDPGDLRWDTAIYEDEECSLELSILALPRRKPGEGLLFLIPPCGPDHALRELTQQVVKLGVTCSEAQLGMPVIPVISSVGGGQTSRYVVSSALYGHPDEVLTESRPDGYSHVARFRPTGMSLFSNQLCREMASMWWLQSTSRTDPLSLDGRAWDNPWSRYSSSVLPFPGTRFAVRDAAEAWDQPAVMHWVT